MVFRRYTPLEAPPRTPQVLSEERRSVQRAIGSLGEDLERFHGELEAKLDEKAGELSQEIDERVSPIEQFLDGLGQMIYDMAHPVHSVLILDHDAEPVVPEGVTATWTAIGAGRVLMSVDSGAGTTGGSATVDTSYEGGHDHGGATGEAGGHAHTFSGNTGYAEVESSKHAAGQTGNQYTARHRHSFSGTTSEAEDHAHMITAVEDHSHTVDISDPPHFKVRMWRRIA